MERGNKSDKKGLLDLALHIDNWTLSIAFGCLSMLLVVQGLLQVPSVRAAADRVQSGFETVNAQPQPATVHASVQLSMVPNMRTADVVVLVEGREVANFAASTKVTVSVQNAQGLTIQNESNNVVYITVVNKSQQVLSPQLMQRVTVQPGTLANFPLVRFQDAAS